MITIKNLRSFKGLGSILLVINIISALIYIIYKTRILGIIYLILGIIAVFFIAFGLQDHEDNKNFEREKWGDNL